MGDQVPPNAVNGSFKGFKNCDHLYDTAAGGMYSSAGDVNKFMQAFFGNNYFNKDTQALLNNVNMMVVTGNKAEPYIGLGFYSLDKQDKYRGHGGVGLSSTGYAIYDRDQNTGVTVLASTTDNNKSLYKISKPRRSSSVNFIKGSNLTQNNNTRQSSVDRLNELKKREAESNIKNKS